MVMRKPLKRSHNNDGEGFLNDYTLPAIYNVGQYLWRRIQKVR